MLLKVKLFSTLFAGLFIATLSAQDLSQVLLDKNYPVDFIGVDYSKSKLVGSSSDFSDPEEIVTGYFPKWNNFFYIEDDKFNMEWALRKKEVNVNTDIVFDNNKATNVEALRVTRTPSSFTDEEIQRLIKTYDFEAKNDVSVVIVVNALNKFRRQFVANIVYFDSNSRTVLLNSEVTSEPKGIGFRNFWLNGLYNFLDEVRSKEFKIWKKKYK